MPFLRVEKLVEQVWAQLWAWNGYDFTSTSYGLNRGKYSDQRGTAESAGGRDVAHV